MFLNLVSLHLEQGIVLNIRLLEDSRKNLDNIKLYVIFS